MSRILITSALPYINGVKHLGNLVGSMLPADVYARFQRAQGREVLFICATDEHGTPAELAALEEGLTVADYCRKWHAIQKDLSSRFLLSFDHFGRSSSPENHQLTQEFAKALWEAGFIEERTTKQVYSHADKRFLPDRYVIGTCPHCGYDRARGDQCENCTRVLDPVDLLEPRSAVSGSSQIEIRDSKHLFLKQTAFEGKLRCWIEGKRETWPGLVTSIALKWLDEGLQDRGITRDLEWGVPVDAAAWGANPSGTRPDAAALAGKVFYVWFDAPIEYIGATAEWAAAASGRDWESWWRRPAADDVTYVQFMGKDNVPFHTVGFPCTLFGLNEKRAGDVWTAATNRPWKLVDDLKGFNWLNYYGGKFSTSQKRGVFMDTALDLLPADYWRWYLISNAPEGSDANFTWPHFQSVVNKDLADVLGNFVNRILKFAKSRTGETIPKGGAAGPLEERLFSDLDRRLAVLAGCYEAMEFRKAAQETRAIFVAGNEYLQEAAPWTAIKTDAARASFIVRTGINLVHLFAHIAYPLIPATALRLHEAAAGFFDPLPWPKEPMAVFLSGLKAGEPFSVPDLLFAKIEDEKIAEWEARFGGAA